MQKVYLEGNYTLVELLQIVLRRITVIEYLEILREELIADVEH